MTFSEPSDNLALDEILLEYCESNILSNEIIRFWEPANYFIVLGYSRKLNAELHLTECNRRNIPIYRRASGGGTVFQGSGCLNYSLFLKINKNGHYQNITSTNQFILNFHKKIFQELSGLDVEIQGDSDLTIANKKFSGNAQWRKINYLLYHGTILLDFNISIMENILKIPDIQPQYRAYRTHQDFLTNIPIPAEQIKMLFKKYWNASGIVENISNDKIRNLSLRKYLSPKWINKF